MFELAVSPVNGINRSSYEMFCYLHPNGKTILDVFNIQNINPKDVTLKPCLLKRKQYIPLNGIYFTNDQIINDDQTKAKIDNY